MEEIRLRTMTEKSVVHFWKYEGCTVRQIMDVDLPYLIWMYYTIESVDYCDDLLAKLHMVESLRIEKPGKIEGGVNGWWKYICKHLPSEEYLKIRSSKKKKQKISSHKTVNRIANIPKCVSQSLNIKRMNKS